DATVRTWHVYYIKNSRSADLERLLQQAFTPGSVTASEPGSTAPGGAPLTMGAGPLFETGVLGGPGHTTQGTPGTTGVGPTPGATPAAAPANPPPSAAPLSTEAPGPELANRIRIIADRRNNALLVFATAGEYSVIEGMLRKIDIIPLQVLIEATIAEVTLNDALQYGTQFYLKNSDIKYTLGATPVFPVNFAGFAASVAPHVIIQALADVTQVKVLSAPRLLVMDNQPAHLQVGQEVPILTGTATSTLASGAPIVNSIDYHSTGVIMQVTPRVNSDGLVTLDLAQEVSDVAAPAANTATGSPTFDDRIVRTSLAVQDGQTVGVAGLIRDSAQEQNSGVPFLKDIPVISTLLSTQNNTRTRTELLVLITPHVVQDQRSARALTDDLRNELFNAGTVPQDLQRKPATGRPNPNGL
ncbi:MAG TPA: secretin N-terminal domain-containing protein, partial [Stellaceae bacterium]|nr:secretin N-terminal domain-containing protein [Stellaceae bacterium]